MLADVPAPFGPVDVGFPFINFFYDKLLRIPGCTEMNKSKTASSYIGNNIPFFEGFSLGNAGDYAVKMNRSACILILNSGSYIFYRFPAP
jgi:hypothetical protein